MDLPLKIAFILSHKFRYVVFSFSFNSERSLVSVLAQFSFSSEVLSFQEFINSLVFPLLLTSSFNPWWSDRIQGVISVFLYLMRFALCPNMWSILEVLRRYIRLCLGGIFCRYLLGLFDL